jgi:hypothetical protein
VFSLPVVSVALLLRRRWVAMVPLSLSLALFSLWFFYYATDWWSNPGLGGAWATVLVLVLPGWLLVIVEARRVRASQP